MSLSIAPGAVVASNVSRLVSALQPHESVIVTPMATLEQIESLRRQLSMRFVESPLLIAGAIGLGEDLDERQRTLLHSRQKHFELAVNDPDDFYVPTTILAKPPIPNAPPFAMKF